MPTETPESAHWDEIYRTRASDELGWYEPTPATLPLVRAHSAPTDPVIDIGGGDSRLVDELLLAGYTDVSVLDISDVALQRSQERLGSRATEVAWICADVTRFEPTRTWNLWHDRAVFHFLVDQEERAAYCAAAARALVPGGRLVMAVFSPEGPDRCAGLPVARYDAAGLATALGPDFEPISAEPLHPTRPGPGDSRPYLGAVFQRR